MEWREREKKTEEREEGEERKRRGQSRAEKKERERKKELKFSAEGEKQGSEKPRKPKQRERRHEEKGGRGFERINQNNCLHMQARKAAKTQTPSECGFHAGIGHTPRAWWSGTLGTLGGGAWHSKRLECSSRGLRKC